MAVVVNSTAITVTWEEPVTPNGVIRGYNISYSLPDSGDEVVINVEPIVRTVTVGDLSPFTFYEFTVAAFTIEMGPGETVSVTTDQAGLWTACVHQSCMMYQLATQLVVQRLLFV